MTSGESSVFKVRISRRAESYLRRADRKMQRRIAAALEAIRQSPTRGPHIKPLEGTKWTYRYEFGDFRVIYSVNLEERTVDIHRIGPRGDIYKK